MGYWVNKVESWKKKVKAEVKVEQDLLDLGLELELVFEVKVEVKVKAEVKVEQDLLDLGLELELVFEVVEETYNSLRLMVQLLKNGSSISYPLFVFITYPFCINRFKLLNIVLVATELFLFKTVCENGR